MTTPSKAGQNRPQAKFLWEEYDGEGFCSRSEADAIFESLELELAVTRRELELAVKDVNDHLQENRAPGVLSAEDYLISARKERGQ
jgi:hypothetical protein